MKKIFFLAFSLLSFFSSFSQRGKDGVGNITTANTIVNLYTPVTAWIGAGQTNISVVSSAGFSPGDLVFFMQMQGALPNASIDAGDTTNSLPANMTHGEVQALNYNWVGNHEFAQVASVPDGTTIVIDCGASNWYNSGNKVQLIRVPRYSSLTISGAGSITCPNWNGSTGGIAVVEVETNATLSSSPAFDVSGKGFRGGVAATTSFSYTGGGNKFGSTRPREGGMKGESIVGWTTAYGSYASVYGRGPMANGGGGGCTHNSGGGGGANGGLVSAWTGFGNPAPGYNTMWNLESAGFAGSTSSGGGRGGYTYSDQNANVSTTAPTSTVWGGDNRRPVGGYGGRPTEHVWGGLFLGGGGGAGHGNNIQAGSGGAGGGMVYIRCYGNLTGTGTILADGANGGNTVLGCSDNDGGGGGGGGGTIMLNVAGTINLTAATALFARGGTGGNVNYNCSVLINGKAYGPGGGGGGGYIETTSTLPANNVAGGNNGIVTGVNNTISNNFPPNGATRGGAGSSGTANIYTIAASNTTICLNNAASLTATSNVGGGIGWYDQAYAGTLLGSGVNFTTTTYTTAGTYSVYVGFCPGSYRFPVQITVTNGPTLTVNTPTICNGTSTVLTASGATNYTWTTGVFTASTAVTPTATTVYTVSGALAGGCSANRTATVIVNAIPNVTVAPQTICSGGTATLSAGGASTYSWSTGAITSSITSSPTISTTYTVTGTTNSCSASQTTTVTVNPLPVISSSSIAICSGQTGTLTASGASTYTWNPGGLSGTSVTVSPSSNQTYTVSGTSSVSCVNSTTTMVNVTATPTLSSNSATICPGTVATLTVSGATTYTWNPGGTTGTSFTASPPSSAIYTVTGSNGACVGTRTTNITVNPTPTVASASVTICSGQMATLTASGASTYTWNPGNLTGSSITVSPSSNQTYSVTGTSSLNCVNTATTVVNVTATPTLSSNSATVCAGTLATLTVTGASSFTWNPGGSTGSTFTASPGSTTIYTVSGSNGTCVSSRTTNISVNAIPSISSASTSICPGQTGTLSASGATTYTWNPGNLSGISITVSPSSTQIYTVTGTNSLNCTGTATTLVNVLSSPTLVVNSPTLCSGSAATLTVGGANTYTWNPGNLSGSSVTVSPSSSQIYTVVGTSTAGCNSAANSTVNVTTTPTVAVSSTSVCPGGTGTLTASGASSYTWNPGGATGATFTASPGSTSTYTVTGANGSCLSSNSASIIVGAGISISASNATICSGQTATLSASGATTYTWSTGATGSSATVNPISNTTYTINGTTGSCSGTQTVSVQVDALPSVSSNTVAICSGQTATLTASGASTYTWNPGNLTGTSVTVSPASSQIFTVAGTSSLNCVNTATTSVGVTTTPTVSVPSVTICAGGTGTLTASGATTYTWNPGSITGATFTDSPSSNSIYTVTGANGACINTATAGITVGSAISISVNSATICSGQTATLTASGASSYTWSTGASGTSITVNPSTNSTYTVDGTVSGCSGSQTVSVQVDPLPSVVSSTAAICSGQATTLTASGAATYTWFPGNLSGGTVTVSPVSSTNYTVMGTSSLTCINTAVSPVSVTNTPTLAVASVSICTGQTATLTASGATNYTWNPGGITGSTFTDTPVSNTTYTITGETGNCISVSTASVDVGSAVSVSVNNATLCSGQTVTLTATSSASSFTWSTGANSNTIVVNPTVTTIYSVNATAGACMGSGTSSVTVNSTPTLNIDGSNICVGQSVTLSGSGASSYTWNPTGVNTTTLTDSPTTTTTYTLYGDVSGCTGMSTYTVTVNPNPTLTVNSPTICGGAATLIASGASVYLWSPGSLTGSTIVVSPTVTSTYTVSGDSLGCQSAITTTVTVTSAPPLMIASDINAGCPGACMNFSATTSDFTGLIFDFGDGSVQTPSVTNHCYSAGGSYTVYASGTYSNGCSVNSANTLTISITPPPAPSFATNGGPFYPNTNVNFVNSTSGVNYYAWSFGDGTSSAVISPSHAYSNAGNYCIKLVATDSITGCKDSVTNCIDVMLPVSINIPNIFTPNDDGVNEVFKASGVGIRQFTCAIFDRWGLKMYEWDGIGGGWDGKTKAGVAVSTGTYFYIITYTDITDKTETIKGFLMLYKD